MFSTSDYSDVYARVKDVLGEFWRDFDIAEIISRAYKIDGEHHALIVDETEFWKIAEECDKSSEGVSERYDYRAALRNDIDEAICAYDLSEFETRDEAEDSLCEGLWMSDAVTGNGSGSYTCNAWRAQNYLAHNWDLLAEALSEFGHTEADVNILEKGAEWCDVTIRCYLLSECLNAVLDELENVGVVEWNR